MLVKRVGRLARDELVDDLLRRPPGRQTVPDRHAASAGRVDVGLGRAPTLAAYHDWKRIVVRFQTTRQGGRSIRPGCPVIDSRRGEYVGVVTSCTSVDRYQIGQALVNRAKVRTDDLLRIFPTAGGKPPPPIDLSQMGPGDKIPLALEVRVLDRFMRPGEIRHTAAGMGG